MWGISGRFQWVLDWHFCHSMQGFPKYMHKTYKYQLAGTNSGAQYTDLPLTLSWIGMAWTRGFGNGSTQTLLLTGNNWNIEKWCKYVTSMRQRKYMYLSPQLVLNLWSSVHWSDALTTQLRATMSFVAQWLEHLASVCKVIGSIPVRGSDIFSIWKMCSTNPCGQHILLQGWVSY